MDDLNMQHASFPRSAAAPALHEPLGDEGRTHVRSRSARCEIALRELAKLQAQAAHLAAIIEAEDEQENPASAAGQSCPEAAIRAILQARLERNSFFPGELFSDPCWDMLLDLYAAELSQIRVPVSSLCIASNAPTSTALRWISVLERRKLIERRPDPLDGRRFFLSLTRDAVERFERYFSTLKNRAVI